MHLIKFTERFTFIKLTNNMYKLITVVKLFVCTVLS